MQVHAMLRQLFLFSTFFLAQTVFAAHPCVRKCNTSTVPMTCHYEFKVEPYQTLSKACHACAYGNVTDCAREDCIYGDGVVRPITVVNRQMPGPAIRVCLNDKIEVNVHNELGSDSTSLHWHGHHQVGTPYMDGVPHVTQCPIPPATTFRYTFKAANPGTHLWHSHSGVQRGDGAFGALIIEDIEDPHQKLYDFDLPEHSIVLIDWLHQPTHSFFVFHHFGDGGNKPVSMLINGKGRFGNGTFSPSLNSTPLENFSVRKGNKYRFRLINAGFHNCPMEISVDNHTISVIASDGFNLQPTFADSLVSYAGERFDFVLNANQSVGRYWLRVRGLMDCDQRFNKVHQLAIISYEGTDLSKEPEPTVGYNQSVRIGKQLNSMNVGSDNGNNNTTTMAEISSLNPGDIKFLNATADHTFYLGYDFYSKDNPVFHTAGKYGFKEVFRNSERRNTPQLNNISMVMPATPMIMLNEEQINALACNESSLALKGKVCGTKDFCTCLHRLRVKVNDIIDFVIFDEGNTYDANHPFHLHGHAFHVMAVERLGNFTSKEAVKNHVEKLKLKKVNLHAPLKDTVTIPDGGFSLLRIRATNPGVWLFHCHMDFHVEVGMAFVLQVGAPESFVQLPSNFPRCGDWKGSDSSADLPKDKNVNQIVSPSSVKEKNPVKNILDNISHTIKEQLAQHGKFPMFGEKTKP